MRIKASLLTAGLMTICSAAAIAQTPRPSSPPAAAKAPAPAAAPAAAAPAATPAPKQAACANPDALGVGRTVEIDTTGGPGFGFEHFKQLDFLRDKEVVLTFDDGPWLNTTPAVLRALAHECTKGIFFPIGKHATYYPEILKNVYQAGHTVGGHTWGHIGLNRKNLTDQQKIEEIEKGFSAVRWAIGADPQPFFRFPQLQHPPAMVTYLGNRNVASFSTDIDSFDFKTKKSEQVTENVMKKLDSIGKGIILMHDFQKHTAEALPSLLRRLKEGGYKVVHMRAAKPFKTMPEYDATLITEAKLPTVSTRPTSSVVKDVAD